MARWLVPLAAAAAAAASLLAACASRPVEVVAGAPPPASCPLEGCGDAKARAIASAAPLSACPEVGQAPCAGAPASECTDRALAAWAEAQDERGVACVAGMLGEACSLGEPRACGFAGRLSIDGRGVPRDPTRGIAMLARACDDGVVSACQVAVRWLADPQHAHAVGDSGSLRARLDLEGDCLSGVAEQCFDLGRDYFTGRAGFPRDAARSAAGYARGCALGHREACNNFADAYEYGAGVPRDLTRAADLYDRACRLGEPLGCANLGHLIENGEGVPRDVPRARALYRDACAAGTTYACLHAAMSAIESPATPAQAQRALERWEHGCAARDARACAFVGLVYEDGPDGLARDQKKSLAAMTRGCTLGDRLACEWQRSAEP
jgi:TPR repeat protein